MVDQLLQDIIHYFEYLKKEHGFFVAFHNACIPLNNHMALLSPYNINSNPYCLCVKASDTAWTHCIKRQPRVFEKCRGGYFFGTCYAGMGEYVFPIIDGKVLGFVDVSGYCFDMQLSQSCIRRIAKEYMLSTDVLSASFAQNVQAPLADVSVLQTLIAPLCHMFVLLNRELTALYGTTRTESDTSSYILSHAVVFLERNYMSPIHVRDVAAACHCSVSYISHMFKKNVGCSVYEYVNRLRIRDAKKLLSSTNFSIRQISDMVGFSSSNYMCEVFRASEQMSPRAYRSSVHESAAAEA